jgi:hypothetical protein
MIDLNDADIVRARKTADGRWVLFSKKGLPKGYPIPWCRVTAEIGGADLGFIARIDDRYGPEGWTLPDLIFVATARAVEEQYRRPGVRADEIVRRLGLVREIEAARLGPRAIPIRIRFGPGRIPSPYWWPIASLGPLQLPLCPDPESRGEGITLEQVLIVIEQMLTDAARALPRERRFRAAQAHAAHAIAAEIHRVALVRAEAEGGETT